MNKKLLLAGFLVAPLLLSNLHASDSSEDSYSQESYRSYSCSSSSDEESSSSYDERETRANELLFEIIKEKKDIERRYKPTIKLANSVITEIQKIKSQSLIKIHQSLLNNFPVLNEKYIGSCRSADINMSRIERLLECTEYWLNQKEWNEDRKEKCRSIISSLNKKKEKLDYVKKMNIFGFLIKTFRTPDKFDLQDIVQDYLSKNIKVDDYNFEKVEKEIVEKEINVLLRFFTLIHKRLEGYPEMVKRIQGIANKVSIFPEDMDEYLSEVREIDNDMERINKSLVSIYYFAQEYHHLIDCKSMERAMIRNPGHRNLIMYINRKILHINAFRTVYQEMFSPYFK